MSTSLGTRISSAKSLSAIACALLSPALCALSL
jgi:hypothetical protein